ncbi:cubilin-like [Stylophora pistillata]|uniref:cubilin-like n=1 Tax=Stylophora pistillata TaxID=50429 RepID=UPI000C03B7F9|nr:cubilin-like [Stylophora pistillata]
MRSFFLLFVLQTWNVTDGSDAAAQDCGSVVNDTLKSPNYPEGYPHNMDCEFIVPIPSDFRIKVTFEYIKLPNLKDWYECMCDYLTVRADNRSYGKYCGAMTGETILVTGNYIVINFHAGSGFSNKERGFVLQFEVVDPPVQPSICPTGWYYQYGSSCYKFSSESLTWNEAVTHCQSLGGYLVKIDDANEQSFITEKIKEMRHVQATWIGLHDPDNSNNFKWIYDDTLANFSNWNTNEPNNPAEDCATAYGVWYDMYDAPFPAGKWNDIQCSVTTYFICEKNADCGSVVNNTLKSPNYPKGYPHNMKCSYSVPIPPGKRMKIKFQYFKLPDPITDMFQCLEDFLMVHNEQEQYFGSYCGTAFRETIFATGNKVVLKFQSLGGFDSNDRGFLLHFEAADPPGKTR